MSSLTRLALLVVFLFGAVFARADDVAPAFPVTPQVVVDEPFRGCEGISFNGEGRLFATCNRALWEITPDGGPSKLADFDSNLGTAPIGERDLLVADFGPTNAFRHGRNDDGIVWRVTPEGARTVVAEGIGDPNFILVLEDGSFLVSDDATSDIYRVDADGEPVLYTTAVNHPNGMVLSLDGRLLYVAQIFSSIRPVVPDDAVWAIPLEDGRPARGAKLVVRAGPNAAVDGLAMDIDGRIYIAANGAGQIWRYDPANDEMLLVADGMFGVASLAFGQGAFDRHSLYATATHASGRGGKIWRIPVGIAGAPLYR